MSHHNLFLKPTFLRTPSQNGVGRYVCQLQRVVLKFCKSHGASRGLREFIESDLVEFAKENPGIVVYLKPRRHRGPVIVGEYLNGERQHLTCRNFTREEINKWLNLLKRQQEPREGIRLRKLMHTDYPSIQGPWTPYTFRDPALNLAQFPNARLGAARQDSETASESLIELFRRQQISAEGRNEVDQEKEKSVA